MHFGENQLSRSLIGLSPLSTAHPLSFQPKWVRSSTTSYRRFNLAMDRSLRFGSRARDSNALFGLAFATASPHGLTSPRPLTRRLILQKARRHPTKRLRRIVGTRFQVLFHSPPGVLFTFPSRYLSAIGHQGVFRLNGWSRQIHTRFHGPRATWEHSRGLHISFTRALTHYGRPSQTVQLPPQPLSLAIRSAAARSEMLPQPPTCNPCRYHTRRFSLFRFRSPLLTESQLFSLPVGTEMFHFPTFPPTPLYIQGAGRRHDSGFGFPHSDILGSQLVYQLPEAYRRFQRPSSALDAKASTVCP
jgi:hypothetical protein